jgi:hypothetical protein
MDGALRTRREYDKCLKILFGKPEKKRLCGRPKHGWKDKIKVGLKEMLCDCVDGTYLNYLPMVIY